LQFDVKFLPTNLKIPSPKIAYWKKMNNSQILLLQLLIFYLQIYSLLIVVNILLSKGAGGKEVEREMKAVD